MNQGLRQGVASERQAASDWKTQFCIGAVTTNFKLREGEVVPQYLKLEKKIECGAQFIINQIGFDSRKISELRGYMDAHGMKEHAADRQRVSIKSASRTNLFTRARIPGVVVTEPLLELCRLQGQSPDGGKAFFIEFAAKQIAIYRGLGYRGVYLGGVHDFTSDRQNSRDGAVVCARRLEAVCARNPVFAAGRIFLLRGESGDRPRRLRARDAAAPVIRRSM